MNMSARAGLDGKHELYGSIRMPRLVHVQNLMTVMRNSMAQQDFRSVAAVSAALLCVEDPQQFDPRGSSTSLPNRAEFMEVARGALEALHHLSSPEAVKTALRKVKLQLAAGDLSSELVVLELAGLLMQQGELQQAYDLITSTQPSSRSRNFCLQHQRTLYCGIIRYQQWLKEVKEVADVDSGGLGLPEGTRRGQRVPFAASSSWWGQVQRRGQVRDFWRDAEKHLTEALQERPDAVPLAHMLVHLYVVAGKLPEAHEAAQAAAEAAPHDLDAVTLVAVLGEAFAVGARPAVIHALAPTYLQALRIDPCSPAALAGILAACDHCSSCRAAAALGMLLHLDCCDPLAGLPQPPAALNGSQSADGLAVAGGQGPGGDTGAPSSEGGLQRRTWQQLAASLVVMADAACADVSGDDGSGADGKEGVASGIWQELECRREWWPALQLDAALLEGALQLVEGLLMMQLGGGGGGTHGHAAGEGGWGSSLQLSAGNACWQYIVAFADAAVDMAVVCAFAVGDSERGVNGLVWEWLGWLVQVVEAAGGREDLASAVQACRDRLGAARCLAERLVQGGVVGGAGGGASHGETGFVKERRLPDAWYRMRDDAARKVEVGVLPAASEVGAVRDLPPVWWQAHARKRRKLRSTGH